MISIYKITTSTTQGALYMRYKNGSLVEAWFQFDPELGVMDKLNLSTSFPFQEVEIESLRQYGFVCVELKPRTVADKIAMFCMSFKAYRGTAYNAKKNEKANLADVVVNKELLAAYFDATDFPLNYAKSINDYVRHFNFIRDIAKNGKPVKNSFPDVYDAEYARGLEGEKLSAYWVHLKGLGWSRQDGVWLKDFKG